MRDAQLRRPPPGRVREGWRHADHAPAPLPVRHLAHRLLDHSTQSSGVTKKKQKQSHLPPCHHALDAVTPRPRALLDADPLLELVNLCRDLLVHFRGHLFESGRDQVGVRIKLHPQPHAAPVRPRTLPAARGGQGGGSDGPPTV